ncbi:2-polyprenyl-3-methyl-5-hydroxy-6-metoxy-1,4-benzoquinol methylase [Flavobacterium arsenatis]|uniref:2-polyprenyl-3-methyl-5-hydroxy-6-metoxy-1, 4-benzoquinol methylase n=1 Tax=Flavobacterium arsenatis TaxID=1484332 RepID=A0ABU1TPN7_9FLAO|nr:methyltransferase domain-containing protein [Flavobacterium arsenatis]MDR6967372.1 2-polyprenyl-3-methyl-5-hydroxy-6-metoxy-1,4-benzoquinol methylase [Flavobacterium arsenatis]
MKINTKYRSSAPEIMDDFSLEGDEIRDALDKIAKINQFLGGNKLTLDGVKQLLKNGFKNEEITIVDIGCGNGDMLRKLADFANEKGYNFNLIGIDANSYTIKYAENLSKDYSNVSYKCKDIFEASFRKLDYDIALCTLTLHHFKDDEIIYLLDILNRQSKMGIVINDLHRSTSAYKLFKLLCSIFKLNKMSEQDGLVSILRGFKKEDLVLFSKKLNLKNYTIQWKWAFRYQWIISKI